METLIPPTVIGALSTESKFVIVENHLPGTTVKLISDLSPIVEKKERCTGGRDVIKLSRSLIVGESLTATQESPSGGQPSPPSREPVITQQVPSRLPPPRIEGILHQCTEFVRLS